MERKRFGFDPETNELLDPQIPFNHDETPQLYEAYNAFTRQKKEIIKYRDGYQCQHPEHLNGHHHECTQHKGLVVHHVKPQSYLKEFGVDPDFIENGITLCQAAHDKIHPNIAEARKRYKPKGDSFLRVQKEINEQIHNRVPFWVTTWDRAMETIALRNTQRMEEKLGVDLNTGEVIVDKKRGLVYKAS